MVRWYIGNSKGLADEMFAGQVVGNINLLGSRIVDWVLSNVDARGIIYHNRCKGSGKRRTQDGDISIPYYLVIRSAAS